MPRGFCEFCLTELVLFCFSFSKEFQTFPKDKSVILFYFHSFYTR